ncbi:hypothetical protein IAQ61_010130 [Plenodomus lingam]|uniref:uncharacterized protein n=1 Tax=Leptosphaeria maculans TaxID=5022 RepID=UPI0033348773|nr:hypothetical protein IAQ61_010130 [Plenodomus lingam]
MARQWGKSDEVYIDGFRLERGGLPARPNILLTRKTEMDKIDVLATSPPMSKFLWASYSELNSFMVICLGGAASE